MGMFLKVCASVVMLLPDEKPERVFDFSATEGLVDSWCRCKVINCTVSCFQCLRRCEINIYLEIFI